MSKKSAGIAAMIEDLRDQALDAHYLGYFECFNRQLYFEAHDVLEEIWLPQRKAQPGDFYKGLIQLAGAFVHLQKGRLRPAGALFKLVLVNLGKYPGVYDCLDVVAVRALAETWLQKLEATEYNVNPLRAGTAPHLALRRKAR